MKKLTLLLVFWVAVLVYFAQIACAEGHYQGGITNIRDFVAPPEEGFVVLWYNPFYMTDDIRDNNGNKIESFSGSRTLKLGPGERITVDVTGNLSIKPELKSYTTQPLLAYFKNLNMLGGVKYGLIVAPAYNYLNVKVKANLTGDVTINGRHFLGVNRSIKVEDSASGFGDLMVRPVMLDWGTERYDIVTSYSFYAPTGGYDKNDLANTGLGYWSHELTLGGLLYFNKKATALLANATYEFNTEKEDSNVTPGQNVILEYGVSQYLAKWLAVGVGGASYFQTTKDSGSGVFGPNNKSQYHLVGGEIVLWPKLHKFGVQLRYFYQYYSESTSRGQGVNLTGVIVF